MIIKRKGFGNDDNEKGETQIFVKNKNKAPPHYIVRIRRIFLRRT